MILIHSNFDFLDRPWWKTEYDDRDVQYFISDTRRLQQAILLSVNSEDEHFWKGYINLHLEHYLIECISAESDVNVDVVKQLLNESVEVEPSRSHLAKKVRNLRDTIDDIFPSRFFPNLPMNRFTPLLARQLHQQVGRELINNAGHYRTKSVMAAQDEFVYMEPRLIESEIEKLFRQCRETFEREDLQLVEAVKFGACFLAYFLYIHPFANGNGRVARLLLSYLLSRFTVVPLSLYSGAETRNVYLQCLREAQWFHDPPFNPSALANFILENIHSTSHNICVTMDINTQNT